VRGEVAMEAYQVTLDEAAANLEPVIKKAMDGVEVTIKVNDASSVMLLPHLLPPGPRKIGTAKGKIKIREDFKDIPEGFEDYVP
jgi:antitoxin (DNA-binding transcriptional repressor) of toxin-antitoxin stability system